MLVPLSFGEDALQRIVDQCRKDDVSVTGWITPLVRRIVEGLCKPGEMFTGSRAEAQSQGTDKTFAAKRAKKVDTYIAGCVSIEIVTFALAIFSSRTESWVHCACAGAIVIVALRALGIVAIATRVAVFDSDDRRPGVDAYVSSARRIVVLGFINFIELILCFASIYAFNPGLVGGRGNRDWIDPIHLSAMSQFTIGYGDIYPLGALRVVVWCQAFFGTVLLVLMIGRFVSLIRHVKLLDDSAE